MLEEVEREGSGLRLIEVQVDGRGRQRPVLPRRQRFTAQLLSPAKGRFSYEALKSRQVQVSIQVLFRTGLGGGEEDPAQRFHSHLPHPNPISPKLSSPGARLLYPLSRAILASSAIFTRTLCPSFLNRLRKFEGLRERPNMEPESSCRVEDYFG